MVGIDHPLPAPPPALPHPITPILPFRSGPAESWSGRHGPGWKRVEMTGSILPGPGITKSPVLRHDHENVIGGKETPWNKGVIGHETPHAVFITINGASVPDRLGGGIDGIDLVAQITGPVHEAGFKETHFTRMCRNRQIQGNQVVDGYRCPA